MKGFIEVTGKMTGTKIYVNMSHVWSIEVDRDGDTCLFFTETYPSRIAICESVDDLEDLIREVRP